MRAQFVRPIVATFVVVLAACSSPPAPDDPLAELRRHHDEWWATLTADFDRDHDGHITTVEWTRDAASFRRLDRDGDGVLTRGDFDRDLVLPPDLVIPMMLVKAAGGREVESVTIARVLEGVAHMDRNGDGRVDRVEFEAVVPPMAGVDRFATFLAGIDEDHDGLLSRPEFERWLTRHDTDHDGKIARRERPVEGPPPAEGFIKQRSREMAPDFTATPLGGGPPVALSSLVGERPVALIFGSFT